MKSQINNLIHSLLSFILVSVDPHRGNFINENGVRIIDLFQENGHLPNVNLKNRIDLKNDIMVLKNEIKVHKLFLIWLS
ncbi:lipopolysaccharide core heptose(II) kinase RfaY [Escherichia coli]|uniref:lipopolysaccharide core heptose(II) kinase RfaY n=1 Tax=Escherichia coli TaxID=562 RepID=UPI0035B5BF53